MLGCFLSCYRYTHVHWSIVNVLCLLDRHFQDGMNASFCSKKRLSHASVQLAYSEHSLRFIIYYLSRAISVLLISIQIPGCCQIVEKSKHNDFAKFLRYTGVVD